MIPNTPADFLVACREADQRETHEVLLTCCRCAAQQPVALSAAELAPEVNRIILATLTAHWHALAEWREIPSAEDWSTAECPVICPTCWSRT